MEAQEQKFNQWAIVELFGHHTMAGLVSEQAIGGASFIRIDVPAVDDEHPAFTKFYGGAAIYGISPCSEEIARHAAARIRVQPVTSYMLPEPKRQAKVADTYLDPEGDYDRYRDDGDDDEDDPDAGGFAPKGHPDDDEVDDPDVAYGPTTDDAGDDLSQTPIPF